MVYRKYVSTFILGTRYLQRVFYCLNLYNRLYALPMELGKVANFLGAALPGFFISIYGQDSLTPFFCTGVAYGAILIVSIILLYTNSWERPSDEVEDECMANVFEGFKKLFTDILSTLKIRTFRHHLGMYLFVFGAEWLFTAAFT